MGCCMRAESEVVHFEPIDLLAFETLVSEISANLVRPSWDQIDAVIEDGLQKILDFLHMDRAALFQREEPDNERMVLTHLRVRPGCGPPVKPYLSTDSFPWMLQQYLQGRETKYSRIDDLPEEAALDKETLHQYGPEYSAMAVPLFDGDKVFGILALGIAREMVWPDDLEPRVRIVAHAFAGALARKKTDQRLNQVLLELEELKSRLEDENIYLRREMTAEHSPNKIVHQSPVMATVLAKAQQVARTNSSVLLSGETGTGKEMIAAAIHAWSQRSNRTMVRVNCGAIPSALVESEMFGREKGAYTGALAKQVGRFELANESTIFLDEITELPLEAQVKLLRVLQEKEIERLGNPRPILIDVRVIAATNQNLEKAVQDGKFREDLYYRLNVFPIHVPPLRERREDIAMLVWSFVDELSGHFGKKVERISERTMELLMNYAWPGNVRELRNVIERAMIISDSLTLNVELPGSPPQGNSGNLTLKEIEGQHIRKVLEKTSWRVRGKNGAAEILGIKPTTLETRMAKLGIIRPNHRMH